MAVDCIDAQLEYFDPLFLAAEDNGSQWNPYALRIFRPFT
jgi:hypothetical protein